MDYLRRERSTAVVIILWTFLVLFYIIPNFIETAEEFEIKSLSPAFFPEIATCLIGGLAGLYLLVTFTKRFVHQSEGIQEGWLTPREELQAVFAAGIIVCFLLAIKLIGYLVSTPLALIGLFYLQGEKRFFKPVIIALLTTIGVYLLFRYLLNVQFPPGLLFKEIGLS